MAKFWSCAICGKQVSELGPFAKLAGAKYAHIACWEQEVFNAGKAALREELVAERARAEEDARKRREAEEAYARAEAERRAEVAERERTNRILAQQKIPLPPKVEPKKEETKEPEKHDRFELIETD